MSLLLAAGGAAAAAAEPETIRMGLLAYGSAQWEVELMRRRGLDASHGLVIQPVEMAGKDGSALALLAGNVDVIVSDWLWVSRQRAMGHDLTFVPWSTMTGAVLVPADSPIHSLADLAGKHLGIAGGPLDKSWLLLRALAARRDQLDLDKATEKVFGAPPLLSRQFEAGRLDALLTFWQEAVPLEMQGARRLIDVAQLAPALGFASNPALMGWVFRRDWADGHRGAVLSFLAAERDGRQAMCGDAGREAALSVINRAADDATRERLRQGFCAGRPGAWGARERADAAAEFSLLAEIGGTELVGPSPRLEEGIFWPAVSY